MDFIKTINLVLDNTANHLTETSRDLLDTMKILLAAKEEGKPEPPKPPIARILKEGVNSYCLICGSTASKNGLMGLIGERSCDNTECPSHEAKNPMGRMSDTSKRHTLRYLPDKFWHVNEEGVRYQILVMVYSHNWCILEDERHEGDYCLPFEKVRAMVNESIEREGAYEH